MPRKGYVWVKALTPARKAEITAACERLIAEMKARFLPVTRPPGINCPVGIRGRWRGEGVVGYPGIEETAFTQDVAFDHDGGPSLRYTSTIRLIVVNSKLSGANSFQGTVEHCFGKTGLIAISIAQWAFAFGGMVAFGVIVGDSIPHVLQAVLPGLKDIPVLGLLADRRVVIVVFILAISYPLTLYRDIAKVSCSTRRADVQGELVG